MLELAARSVAFGHEGDIESEPYTGGGMGILDEREPREPTRLSSSGSTSAGMGEREREGGEREGERARELARRRRRCRDSWWGARARARGGRGRGYVRACAAKGRSREVGEGISSPRCCSRVAAFDVI